MAAPDHFKVAHNIHKLYDVGPYPNFSCPIELFKEIICINYLRHQVATDISVARAEATKPTRTVAILNRILAFSPMDSIKNTKMQQREDILAMIRLFRLTVLFYALNSLPVPSDYTASTIDNPIPPTRRSELRKEMFDLMFQWRRAPSVINTAFWMWIPIAIEAAKGSDEERKFVMDELEYMTQPSGGPPAILINLIKPFWASGETDWNKCFDEPNYLVA